MNWEDRFFTFALGLLCFSSALLVLRLVIFGN